MKVNRNFNTFTDLKSLELKVPMICLAMGCVSLRRDRRYIYKPNLTKGKSYNDIRNTFNMAIPSFSFTAYRNTFKDLGVRLLSISTSDRH
jgi:hypothetical protein